MDFNLARLNTLTGAARLDQALDQLFRDTDKKPVLTPAIDISEDATALYVTAEIPGLDKKDIALEIKEGVLTLHGEKTQEAVSKERGFHRVERQYGTLHRAFAIPETVDVAKVEAAFKNGVLTITLPKRPEPKPLSIPIQE